MMMRSALY